MKSKTTLEALIEKIDEALRRDVNHILSEVSMAKLSANSARDLVQYRKLLGDTQAELEKAAKGLATKSEEELKALAKDLLK